MKTLNQYELEKVSGGNPAAAVLAGLATALALADAGHSFLKGFRRGWNS